MKGKTKNDKDNEVVEVVEDEEEVEEGFEGDIDGLEQKPKKEKYTNKSDINYAATLESAYDNLDSLIGKEGMDKMSQDTAK
jgi:hypothetical protein